MTGEKVLILWQELAGAPDDAEKTRAFCDAVLLLTHNPDEWKKNRSDVMEKLQVLADKDCAGALTAAGIILKSSREKTDRVKALEMLEKAAGLGDEMALRIYGEICRDGMPGIFERDPEKARECFEKLDEAGNELGSVLLAKLYRMDNDVIERDYMKAFSLLEKAAEKKDSRMSWAAYDVGLAYQGGKEEVPKDPEKAAVFFTKAQERGIFAEPKIKAALKAAQTFEKPTEQK